MTDTNDAYLRLAAGLTLDDDDAARVFTDLYTDEWRMWVRIAVGCLKLGKVEDAMTILERLVREEG